MGCARNELCFFPFGLWLAVHFSFSFHHLSPSVCDFRFASSLPIPIFSEQTRVVLTSAAYVHLKQADISKYTRNLAPASRAILLSGPAGRLSLQCESEQLFNRFVYFCFRLS